MLRKWRWLLGTLAVLLLLPNAVMAQNVPPFTGYVPAGWRWWCGTSGCLLLPDQAPVGSQGRFMLVVPGAKSQDFLPGWMGGGEVVWQGAMKAGGHDWNTTIAHGNGVRGLLSELTDKSWTVCAVSPEGNWGADAPVYNDVLKGGKQ